MKQRTRIYYSEAQKAMMWDRWQRGESLSHRRLFDRNHSSIQGILSRTGGIRPPPRVRSSRALSLSEREGISRGIVAGRSMRSIAASLARAPSTVSREIRRNGTAEATERAMRTRPPGTGRIAPRPVNWPGTVRWPGSWRRSLRCYGPPSRSPAGSRARIRTMELPGVTRDHLSDPLYPSPWRLKERALAAPQATRAMRRSRHYTQKRDHGRISHTVSISERPPSAEDRAVPGHWEGDLIFGTHNSQIATLVERQTRYVMMAKVKGKDTETVINALIKHARQLPKELYASLTWDRARKWPTTNASP